LTLGLDGSGKVDIIAGGYADWEAKRDRRPQNVAKAQKAATAPAAPPPPKAAKLTYKDQRDYDLLPKRIEEIDAEIAKAEAELSDANLYGRNPKRFADLTTVIDALRAEKDAAEERWLTLAEMVEALAS
jgi:ATP-binding cassette subfamily F protein uup